MAYITYQYYSFIICVQLSSQQRRDKGFEEWSYLKAVKVKLTSCMTTGHASIIFKLAYTLVSSLNANATNTAVLQLSMHQALYFQTTLSCWLCRFHNIQLVSLLSRTWNTFDTFTVLQQVVIRRHTGCSRSSSEKVSSTFYPAKIWKRIRTTFLWQPRRWHFTLANQINITQFSHFSNQISQ